MTRDGLELLPNLWRIPMPASKNGTGVSHSIDLRKSAERHLNSDKIKSQLAKIVTDAIQGRAKAGWSCSISEKTTDPRYDSSGVYIYKCKLKLECNKERPETSLKQDFDSILRIVAASADKQKWQVVLIDGKTLEEDQVEKLPKPLGYHTVELPNNWKDKFSHIYDRDNQIDIIISAIQAGIASNFHDRFHCALYGPPGCGKTETLRTMREVLGKDAIMEFDATNTTQAGAIKDLDDRDTLPRILIVEEIEKTDENSLRWLLSFMDHRAEIRKVNFRSNIEKETKLLTLATVNDYELFQRIMYGALASRFSYHLNYPRPDRKILQKILEREILRVDGKKAWIKPTLDYADQHNIHDPRKVTAICLCGRDELLNNSYQTKLAACSPPIKEKTEKKG
jgi:hypothetical protein